MNQPYSPLDRCRYNVLCETLTDEEFAFLKSRMNEVRYKRGEVILEDEQEGEELYLLAEGRVKITKETRGGQEELLALLHSGDFFGELELIDGRPRSARVIAVEDCIAYTLSIADFTTLLREQPDFSFRLLQVLSVRLRALNNRFVQEMERSSATNSREVKKLERLIEASKNLNSTLNLDRLLNIILENALRIVDGDRGTVYLIDEYSNELWSRVLKGDEQIKIHMPLGKGIAGYVGATGDTLNIPNAYFDPRFNPEFDRQTGYRTESILCMPMRNKAGKIIGVFQLLNKRTGMFTEEDESFIEALSDHAALAVENARLYEQERQKIAMEKDLLAAREVQMRLIPKEVPRVPGYEFAAVTLPAKEVGGDLYDFVPLDDGRLAICIGDVSGKGLAASLLMANVQATLRNQTLNHGRAADCVRFSSKLLFQSTIPEKFATLFYCVLDPGRCRVTYSNAGHEPPMLFPAGAQVQRLTTGGVILGIVDDFPFEEETVKFQKGDVMVMFSDGISEAMNENQDQFGVDRLQAVVDQCRNESAAAIHARIIAAVHDHVGHNPQMDDITLLVLKSVAG